MYRESKHNVNKILITRGSKQHIKNFKLSMGNTQLKIESSISIFYVIYQIDNIWKLILMKNSSQDH